MSNRRRPTRPTRSDSRPAQRAHARQAGLRLAQPQTTQDSEPVPVAIDLAGDVTAQLMSFEATSIESAVPLPIQEGETTQVLDELKKLVAQFVGTRFLRIFEGKDEAAEMFVVTISIEPVKGGLDAS